jgi:F0F1-type ATP synthase assembly protein I
VQPRVVALADGKFATSMLVTLILGIGMHVVKLSRKQNKKQFRANKDSQDGTSVMVGNLNH